MTALDGKKGTRGSRWLLLELLERDNIPVSVRTVQCGLNDREIKVRRRTKKPILRKAMLEKRLN